MYALKKRKKNHSYLLEGVFKKNVRACFFMCSWGCILGKWKEIMFKYFFSLMYSVEFSFVGKLHLIQNQPNGKWCSCAFNTKGLIFRMLCDGFSFIHLVIQSRGSFIFIFWGRGYFTWSGTFIFAYPISLEILITGTLNCQAACGTIRRNEENTERYTVRCIPQP